MSGKIDAGLAAAALPPFRARLSWALFDWANQPFFTVITTFIFAPYFTSVLVGNAVEGQALWGHTQAIAGFCLAILSPLLGAVADATGHRKPWIFAFQTLLALACCLLWFAVPGPMAPIGLVMAAIVLATLGAEFAIVFNNAQLPAIVARQRIGRWSGIGWALGYIGGLLFLFAILALSQPKLFGLDLAPGGAALGLDPARHELERATGPGAALWLVIFVVPMFLFTPDRARTSLNLAAAIGQGARQLLATLKGLGREPALLRFLIAYMIYNDGLIAVIAFGGVYASGLFGWGTTQLGLFGILLNVFAIAGALTGGWLDDRLGSRRAISLAISAVILATLGLFATGRESFLGLVTYAPPPTGALFAGTGERIFIAFCCLLGLGMGPMQAASRTMISRLAPIERQAEFYGLFALSGRATAFMAPFLIAIATSWSGRTDVALLVILAFLATGLVLLQQVRVKAGV